MTLGFYNVEIETASEAAEMLHRLGEALDETREDDHKYLAAILLIEDFKCHLAFRDLDNIGRLLDATRMDWTLRRAVLTPDTETA